MSSLDHKIPPPVIALACAGLAWTLARGTPEFTHQFSARLPIAALFILAGFALDLSGLFAFRRAKTTLNPLAPGRSTSIVQSGPYAFTRNPMYLGMALVLLGFCVYLANLMATVAVIVFVAYLTRFQIMPEERLLLGKFGEVYARYTRSVRRWI